MKLKARIMLWLMSTRLYKFTLQKIIPFIRFSTYYPTFSGLQYHEAYSKLLPGDIILTTDKKKLTSLIIPGAFSHAALCIGKDNFCWTFDAVKGQAHSYISSGSEIAEMTHENYKRSCFFDICKEADRVAIFRCFDFTSTDIENLISTALGFSYAKYDDQFTLGVESLYCSELVYQADKIGCGGKLKVDCSDLAGIGRPYVSPDDLARSLNVFCVYDSDLKLTLMNGAEVRDVLR